MALAELLTALETEAATEAARLEADAASEARGIVAAAQAEAHAMKERAARADEDELERELAQRGAAGRLAAARLLREAREESFRTLLARVRDRVGTLRDDSAYPGVLRAAIRESVAALPDATTLRVDPRDERLATELVDELGVHLAVVPTLEAASGLELVSDTGRSVRNTFEERLANAEPALRLLLGHALAGSQEPLATA
jgi:V/A-type H+/Na+-transporting ATPase subunit E